MTYLMLDLCSGLGGASAAMVARGWEVITVDNNPEFHPDVVADVRTWVYTGRRPDLVWASPPCVEFSRWGLPWVHDKKEPDMSLALACKRIIELSGPRYWVIENVKGALPWLTPILGKPAFVCNPYYLWGSFPDISHVKVFSHKEKVTSNQAAARALIPYAISLALAAAIEYVIPFSFYGENQYVNTSRCGCERVPGPGAGELR